MIINNLFIVYLTTSQLCQEQAMRHAQIQVEINNSQILVITKIDQIWVAFKVQHKHLRAAISLITLFQNLLQFSIQLGS